jgi:membrane associated rhomboid family serine protease
MVGASGAISGVMGAYIILYPKVRVHMLLVLGFFITRIVVPAYLMLGYWFLIQVLSGSMSREEGGVAFWAHAGGFVAGAVLIHLFRDAELVAKHKALSRTTEGLVYREGR